MSDNQLDPEQQAVYRESLEEQAKLLGVEFRSTVSDETLVKRIKAAKGESQEDNTDTEEKQVVKAPLNLVPQSELKLDRKTMQAEKRRQGLTMQRVIVSCNDPAKRNWQGEILEVSSKSLGTIKKFVLFDTPYYLPQALIKMAKEKEYQRFLTRRDKYGNETRYGKNVPAFNVSILDNLTQEEIAELAKNQAARGGKD
jgi:hypothetical protein